LDGRDEVTVVNVFTASPPAGIPAPWWDSATGAADPVERMRERREEDACALALAGRASLDLGLLDHQYRRSGLAAKTVVDCLEDTLDPVITLYAPGAFDGHPDHALVRDAACELALSGRRVAIYADLPHAIGTGWPDWVCGENSGPGTEVAARWRAVLQSAGLDTLHLLRRVRSLDGRARARKLRALAAYRTQRRALDRFAFAPLEDPRTLAWEVEWEVTASALGGAQQVTGESVVADAPRETLDDRV
ncbi:MAG: hypothetical protein ACXVRH_06445, partial [Thermoleophilaceae bacterium]